MASPDSAVGQEQGFLSHLIELRDRLLKMLLAVGILFLSLFWFSDKIYTALAAPLLRHLPNSQMIAIDVAAPFFIPFKLTLMLCVFLAVPYLLYQIWSFIAPGLYSHEKKLVVPLLVSSTVLFYLGVAFAYFVVFPLVFGFFTSVAPEGVTVSTDIGRYLDFVITLFFAFGIAFEVPVATVLVVAVGITTPEQLVKIRPYIFVAAFIIGMFLTPPDMISQTLLAIPMWLLYEVGIVFSRKYKDRITAAGKAMDARYNEDDHDHDHDHDHGDGNDQESGFHNDNESGWDDEHGHDKHWHDEHGHDELGYDDYNHDAIGHDDSPKADESKPGGSDDEKTSVVNPALIQKPDANGVYKNSLTDAEDDPEAPGNFDGLEDSKAPSDLEAPEDSKAAGDSGVPENAKRPDDSEGPENPARPDDSVAPDDPDDPDSDTYKGKND